LEEEHEPGKALRQFPTQRRHELGGGSVLGRERNQDLPIHRTDGGRIAQRDIQAAIGQPDIIQDRVDLAVADDAPDFRLDAGEVGLGLLDAAADGGADVQPHLPGVDPRKEVLAKPREEKQGGDHQDQKEADGGQGPGQHPGKAVAVGVAKALEAVVEPAVHRAQRIPVRASWPCRLRTAHYTTHQVLEQDGHKGEGQGKAGDQGQANRQGQRREEVFRRTLQQEDGHEDDADAQRGERGRQSDLAGTVKNGLFQRITQPDMPLDVLDHHRPVVDQDADRESEAAKGHRI
jgi:hypothetical protein